MTDERSIELEVTVAGTPEEVWRAIATGPGISSWYVPHQVEEAEGGVASASFGPGMDVPGVVTVWDPPNRVRFEGVEGEGPGLAFEWTVEARDGGSCVVRLVNSGFQTGTEWDDHYDAMTEGWRLFLANLQMHLEHFGGQSGVAALPMAVWAQPAAEAWAHVAAAVGVDPAPAVGESVTIAAEGAPTVVGVVQVVGPTRIGFLCTEPAAGTGFITAESQGDSSMVSLWLYLYGDDAPALATTHYDRWLEVLNAVGPAIQPG